MGAGGGKRVHVGYLSSGCGADSAAWVAPLNVGMNLSPPPHPLSM